MRMTLADKGPVAPVPTLDGPAEIVSRAVRSWPGVIAAAHWDLFRPTRIDGADFYLGTEELGHIHLNGEVHLATTLDLRGPLVAAGLARPFAYGGDPYDGWVEASIRSERQAERALWLFRLNYDRLAGAPLTDSLARIADAAHSHRRACRLPQPRRSA